MVLNIIVGAIAFMIYILVVVVLARAAYNYGKKTEKLERRQGGCLHGPSEAHGKHEDSEEV